MKIPKFVVLQITTIYLKSYVPGSKSHDCVHVIELGELSSHPLQRPHRHSFTNSTAVWATHHEQRAKITCLMLAWTWTLISYKHNRVREQNNFIALPWQTTMNYPAFGVKNALALVSCKNIHPTLLSSQLKDIQGKRGYLAISLETNSFSASQLRRWVVLNF